MAKTLAALIVWLCIALPVYAAQQPAAKKSPRPAWSELTPAQQKILAPLAAEWDGMDAARRKNWIGIANRYPRMKPQEQERLQQRMRDWAALTPAQRQAARDRYQMLKNLSPEQRRQVTRQWQEYQRSIAAQPELSPSDAPAPDNPTSEAAATSPPAAAENVPTESAPAAATAPSTTTAQ